MDLIEAYMKKSREELEAGIYGGDFDQFSMMEQLEAENKRLRALCLRESKVLREAYKRTHNKSMIRVVANSLAEQALSGGKDSNGR